MSLDDNVSVVITAATKTPTQTGFGTPLVLAYHSEYPERVRSYADVVDMISDGFTTSSAAYKAVNSIFQQTPSPPVVKVGRTANDEPKSIKITPNSLDLRANFDYKVYLGGQEAKYTSGATPTVSEITAGLKVAVDALALSVTTTDNITDLDIDANTVADWFSFYVEHANLLHVQDVTPDGVPGIADDIVAIRIEDDDWYFAIPTNQGKVVIQAAAAAIEGSIKYMQVSSPDHDIIESGSSDLLSVLNTAGYDRTALQYHPKAGEQFPCAGWTGVCAPLTPGSLTWKFKDIAGSDVITLSSTERGYLLGKKGNYFNLTSGIRMTEEGVSVSGEFIDVFRGIDFLTARIQETVFGGLANSKKIPYTDAGIAIIESLLRSALNVYGVQTGLLAEDPPFTIIVPLVANVPQADKANRVLNNIYFSATLAGAIHKVSIEGTLTV